MKKYLDALKGWKTVAFNVVIVVVFALNQVGAFGNDAAPTGEQIHAGLDGLDAALTALASIGNIILRAGVNTTIFKKTSPAPAPEPKLPETP